MIPCYKSVKIVLDKIAALLLLVVLLPIMLMLCVGVYFSLKEIFFIQKRPGLLGQPFNLYKFKTMNVGNGLDKERVTKFGNFLRKSSLDELPQLINILKGEMSFIGPRPYLMKYMNLYSDYHSRRHWVMPGITGWAQTHGGNALSWQEKLDMDVYYVNHVSYWMDIKILFRTMVLLMKGNKTDLPESEFNGYPKTTLSIEN